MREQVVVTGMGAVSPYGYGVPALETGLWQGICSLQRLADNGRVKGLKVRTAGTVPSKDLRGEISRDLRRTMSPMSQYACLAAREAIAMGGLEGDALRRTGVSIGSTLGSPAALEDFFREYLLGGDMDEVRTTTFFKVMGHTAAANVALACGCAGRTLAPAAACAAGLMGIGLAYEAVASGREERMLCGGADEFHPLVAATFEKLGAASHEEDPELASRPFDVKRTGIVCGEGAGVLLLESLTSAEARGAKPLARVGGFSAMTCAGNIAHPDATSIVECMAAALEDAGLAPRDIAAVNAHATATTIGDMAEGQAIFGVFGSQTPVCSLKGHMGHTMAACGVLETIACVRMLDTGTVLPTLGLETPDPACGEIRHVLGEPVLATGPILKNCFALGGTLCALVLDVA
ncbi:MAG: beta-ketoacyl-[acyl-carrier-protein] synthase family protein [Desulfovibrio sp.]|jgi:3-oxoacyl-[acyl-carrier-protein] synthase II|nr:beta-ketoacyl-[acyl-carrier-protein] synthase family protein [Desulfovibrio sp.]